MNRYLCLLFCALLALLLTEPIAAKRTFGGGSRHSYPSSGGLSGSGRHHSYPSSGGLSGGGHGYPSSGGSHSHPSSGGSHGYPSSGGLSGNSRSNPSSGGSHSHPSSGGAGYPSNTHHSNSHGYPSGKSLSGNTNTGHHTTNIHHHYNYNPPQQIRYTPVHGGPPVSYPVWHGSPPTYVYQYRDSGSKYGSLLTGLALLNLGTVAAGTYALTRSHSSYKPQPGEICKFGVKKDNGDYEETKIDCQLITSFIFQEQEKTQQHSPTNTTTITTTVTNVTAVNMTNPGTGDAVTTMVKPNPVYEMLPNGTLVPINATTVNGTATATNESTNATASGGNPMTSSVTVTNTTTTVTNALDVKGKPIEVTPGMQCYVLRHSSSSNMKRSVPCGLLQTYAEKSLQKNAASRNIPAFTILSVICAVFVMY